MTKNIAVSSVDGLSPVLAKALEVRGYETFTSVQSAVMDEEARGRDLVVSAQTGSGKTIAFGLAMADLLIDENDRAPQARSPLALVIAPTRELALQVQSELSWLYAHAGAHIIACVGGMDPGKERRALSQGPQIVVGTPGRLRDHLERGSLNLSAIRAVVLDEADEMLDMGFRDDLEEILDATPDARRTLLFSATMPKSIEALARRYQKQALRISTQSEKRAHADISYQAMAIAPADVENAVVNVLRYHDAETAILFCATRDAVRHLHASLTERGFSVVALSGEHSQNERNRALQSLRDGRAKVCVATDVAARGIDLPNLTLVVHVDMPRDPEILQHRSGRTGRAGRKGLAILMVPFPRRRRTEALLRQANIAAEWTHPPKPADIRAADQNRLLEQLRAPFEADEADTKLAEKLLAEHSPENLANLLVQAHKSALPPPEELISHDDGKPARQTDRHSDFVSGGQFRMNIGRRHNADPRWLLPLLCRRGHITRGDIGAIRIAADETIFDVALAAVDKFKAAIKRTAKADAKSGDNDGDILIEPFATEFGGAPAAYAGQNAGPKAGSAEYSPAGDGGFGGEFRKPRKGGPRGPEGGRGGPRSDSRSGARSGAPRGDGAPAGKRPFKGRYPDGERPRTGPPAKRKPRG